MVTASFLSSPGSSSSVDAKINESAEKGRRRKICKFAVHKTAGGVRQQSKLVDSQEVGLEGEKKPRPVCRQVMAHMAA